MQTPEVSVITVNYNNYEGLKLTLESVLNQTYNAFEYIIIDGGSKDKSRELLDLYRAKFLEKGCKYTYISEKDNGIYDAMNKGIELSRGKWIHFLNSGDQYCTSTVLENVFIKNDFKAVDIIYGRWKKDDKIGLIEGNVYCIEGRDSIEKNKYNFLKRFPKKGVLPTAHLAMFFRGDLMRQRMYSVEYSICADFEWFMYAYHNGKKFSFVNEYICIFDLKGVSSQKLVDTYKQTVSIRHKYGTQDFIIFEKVKLVIWYLIEKMIRK